MTKFKKEISYYRLALALGALALLFMLSGMVMGFNIAMNGLNIEGSQRSDFRVGFAFVLSMGAPVAVLFWMKNNITEVPDGQQDSGNSPV